MQLLHRDRPVTRIDPVVVSLVAELRGQERQAAEELERWKTHSEERKPPDAWPAAITLALLLTARSWTRWRRGLEMERKVLESAS
jgi:hypothetical protein